jgi:glutathione S-transferase
MDYPNLPYLIDGNLKMSETMSIHKYLADKYQRELLGEDAQ